MPPAARLTDMHTCPMATPGTPPVPHVGGPILPPCAPTVLVGGLPQARVTDMASCAGPPDMIAQGAATVLVQGLPAARLGDTTVHGGVIVAGMPTVLIGGPAFTARPVGRVLRLRWGLPPWEWRLTYGKSIEIVPDPEGMTPSFELRVLAALIRLDMTNTMHSVFDAIEESKHRVIIENYRDEKDPWNATCWQHDGEGAQTPGKGSDSTVNWNPDVHGFGPPGATPDWQQPGSDVILAHELIHAAHNATGTHGDNWHNEVAVNEERNTVGLPAQYYDWPGDSWHGAALADTTGQPYTENGLRNEYRERGINSPVTGSPPEPRPSYYTDDPPVF